MQAVGVWEAVQPKLVFGENIAHAAQMAASGAAQVGVIALSLAKFPELATHSHYLIDDNLHNPLTGAMWLPGVAATSQRPCTLPISWPQSRHTL